MGEDRGPESQIPPLTEGVFHFKGYHPWEPFEVETPDGTLEVSPDSPILISGEEMSVRSANEADPLEFQIHDSRVTIVPRKGGQDLIVEVKSTSQTRRPGSCLIRSNGGTYTCEMVGTCMQCVFSVKVQEGVAVYNCRCMY